MKLNNRGFAISTMLYMILVLALVIMALLLAILNSRGKILNNLKQKVQTEINDKSDITDYICLGNNYQDFKVGDKYTCNVSNTESYEFYILNVADEKIDFIMGEPLLFGVGNYGADDDVINENVVAYINDSDFNSLKKYNPITALKVLKRLTDNWFYLDSRIDTIANGTNTIDYTGYKARLLSYSDISSYVNGSDLTIDFIKNTLTSTVYNDNNVYAIVGGKISVDKKVSDEYNIVPVITVSIDNIKK